MALRGDGWTGFRFYFKGGVKRGRARSGASGGNVPGIPVGLCLSGALEEHARET